METITNKEKVNCIQIKKTVYPFCPIGKDFYKADITIDVEIKENYPEYISADTELNNNNGAKKTIEELTADVFEQFKKIDPYALKITVYAESSKHFPVTVTKIL